MDKIEAGEIEYATITVRDVKNLNHEIRKVVFSREWKCEYPILRKDIYSRFLTQNKILTDCEIVDVKIIARTGFKHKDKGYTSAKKNEQIRDSITGAYV